VFPVYACDFFVFLALLFAILDIRRFREEMLLLDANQVFNAGTVKIWDFLLAV